MAAAPPVIGPMNPMEPAHAFPDEIDEPATWPELVGALEAGAEPAGPDSVAADEATGAADEATGAEDASAMVPTVGEPLVPALPELPPAHPLTVRVRQAMAAIPPNKWVWRMWVTTLHSMGCWAASDRVTTTGVCKEFCGRHPSARSIRPGRRPDHHALKAARPSG